MRLAVLRLLPLLAAVPACMTLEEDLPSPCITDCSPAPQDCDGPNPGSCDSWSDCVIDPGRPGYGECGGEVFECQDGEWVGVGWCDPAYLHVEGPLQLDQTVLEFPESCPELAARPSFVLTATAEGTLVAEAPMTVTESRVDVYELDATATATMIGGDVWGDTPVTLDYRLDLNQYGNVQGIGTATAGECVYSVYLTGSYEPDWRF